jgi:hypothetical protein
VSSADPRQRRREPDQKPAAAERTADAPPAPAAGLLALQRTAGNAAVSAWLRSAPGGLLQRDRKVAEDADTLAELGPALKDLVVDEDTVSVSGRAWYFKNDRLPPRPGVGVDIRFGGPMAKDKAKEQAVQNGLGSMALIMFGLNGEPPKKKGEEDWGKVDPGTGSKPGKPRPPTTELVRIVDLDLTEYGGQEGHYRFAAVAEKGAPDKPKEVVIVIELIGPRRKAFEQALDGKRKSALEKRFSGFGFVKRAPRTGGSVLDEPDDTMPWLDDQWAKLLQALELVPEEMLSGVSGIAWARGRGAKGPAGEAGQYVTKTGLLSGDKPERLLTLYDDAFKSDDALVSTVAHEIGHAVSEKPLEPKGGDALSAGAEYQKAANADGGKAITKYGRKSWEEHYAEAYSMFIAEPATMKVMRPNVYAFFEKQQQAAAPRKKP